MHNDIDMIDGLTFEDGLLFLGPPIATGGHLVRAPNAIGAGTRIAAADARAT